MGEATSEGFLVLKKIINMLTSDDLFNDINKPNVFGTTVNDLSKEVKFVHYYNEFLSSEYWQEVRNKMLLLHNNKCQYCGSSKMLQVHHFSYNNHGDELNHIEDLRLLCKDCHRKMHNLK